MTLNNWLEQHFLIDHEPGREEISDLLAVVARDLEDAPVERLSADRRLGIAYNAVRNLACLALAAEGYRPGRQRSHEWAIQSLRLTIKLEQEKVDTLDAVRRMRHTSDYLRAGTASSREVEEVYRLATDLEERVLAWMRGAHPDLLDQESS